MITALALLGYAACAAWCVPALLAPLTRRGASVRAGLAAWLAAMGCVLASAAVAIELSFRTVAADWPQLTQALCRSVAGGACTPEVYRSALYEGGVAAVVIVATLLSALALWRYGRRVQRSRAQTRSHARAALLVGRAIGGPAAGIAGSPAAAAGGMAASPAKASGRAGARAVMLDDPRPAAYCVAGPPGGDRRHQRRARRPRPAATGRGPRARERSPRARPSRARDGHPRAGGSLPRRSAVRPRRRRGCPARRDVRRRHRRAHQRPPALVAALIAIATGTVVPSTVVASTDVPGTAVPRGAMAAAARAVPDRVERLLRPSSPARSAAFTATLTLVLAVLAATPPALTLLVRR